MAALTVVVVALSLQTSYGQSDELFEYRGVKYLMSPFATLFDSSTTLGQVRLRLFVEYLKSSPEGLERVKKAMSDDPAMVWATGLDAEEKTTFLAVTAAASRLMSAKSGTMLSWFEKLDEIHGSVKPGGGVYADNKAFRLYLRLSKDGIAYVDKGGTLKNTCTNKDLKTGSRQLTHPDYCEKGRFDKQRPTRNSPRVQINVTPKTACADVDLDYDLENRFHFTKDNSNVLATHSNLRPDEDPRDFPPHLDLFEGQYCQIGFRRAS
jgi:hypothetical protein